MDAEEKGFSPTQGTFDEVGIMYARTIFDTLMILDAEGTPQPNLAESVTSNTDGTVWTITVRPNVTFHNGAPCDGAAVAASGLTGGNSFESSVFPFIVRDASLIGIDTVRTPIAQRRRVWAEIATRFPIPGLEAIVASEVGLEGVAPALDAIQAGTVRGRILVAPHR